MKLKKLITLLFFATALVCLHACKKPGEAVNSLPGNANLVNTWKCTFFDTVPVTVVFTETAYTETAYGIKLEEGTYTRAGNTLTLTTTAGDCSGKPGKYNYLVSGNKMVFTQVSDSCDKRIFALPGEWVKQ